MMPDASKVVNGAMSKSQGRGISYPFINLEEAIARARKFHDEDRKAAVPVAVAMQHFGYGENSGNGRQTVSALLQFGLLSDEGIKDKRTVQLTNRALQILLDEPNSLARLSAIKEAARAPKLYSELLGKWPEGLPSDSALSFFLQKEKDFNPKTLQSFINNFRTSIAFAKLFDSIKMPRNNLLETPEKPTIPQRGAGIGDLVQWESNGVAQFEEPRQVTGISDDGIYVFVDGSATGVPSKEVTIMPQATPTSPSATPMVNPPKAPPIKPASGTRQDVFSLDEGVVVLQWPEKMSPESYEDFESWIQLQLRKIKRSI
jgi:hypothetical protein